MVSVAAKVVLTVVIFTDQRLASGFVTFKTNSSDPSLDKDAGNQYSYFARFISKESGNQSYNDGYPATGTPEHMSTGNDMLDITIGNVTNLKSDTDTEFNKVYKEKDAREITIPDTEGFDDEFKDSVCPGGDTSDGMQQSCKRRFDWTNVVNNASDTARDKAETSTNQRKKRSPLYHGCCISDVIPEEVKSAKDTDGKERNLTINGIPQVFFKDTCIHDTTCSRCRGCTCMLDYVYKRLKYIEPDSAGNEVQKFGIFKFDHVCRCINH